MKRHLFGTLFALGALLSPTEAHSNGRFPSAGHVEVDPANPAHLVLRATYGLVFTLNGGGRWEWVCEEAMSFAGIWDPPIAIIKGGVVLAGLPDGLVVSSPDACDFSRVGALEGQLVADLALDKTNPNRAVVITSTPIDAAFDSRVFRTTDGGVTFSQVGNAFPSNFRALTIDVAPSDPKTFYVSGVFSGPPAMGALLRSVDSGMTWETYLVPSSDDLRAPYIGAVDPKDASSVYVRLDGAPGRLLRTKDGGLGFEELFLGEGTLLAFALSPDGKTLLVGGEKDGLWRSPTGALAFEQTSTVRARCLRWVDAGVYVCGEPGNDGFSVGLSVTEGSTFSSFSTLADLCGPPPCPSDSGTAKSCKSRWPTMQMTLGATSCDASSGAGGGGSSSSSGSSSASGSGSGGGGGNEKPSGGGGGCHCNLSANESDRPWLVTLVVASILAIRRKRETCARG